MVVVVHVEYFLLLSVQISLSSTGGHDVLLAVHIGKPHGSWDKDIVVLAATCLLHASLAAILDVGQVGVVGRLHRAGRHEVVVLHVLLEVLVMIARVLVRVVVRHISTMVSLDVALLVVAVKVLDVQRSASLVVAQISAWTRLKSHVVGSRATLSVQMLAEVIVRRLDLLVDIGSGTGVVVLASVETEVAMRLVHVVDVVLLLLVHLTRVLVLKDLCQDTLGAGRLARVVLSIAVRVDAHTASVHSVELVLYVGVGPRRPSRAGSARVGAMLLHGGPRDVQLGSLARDEVLGLITARLYHEPLSVGIGAHGTSVDGLPGVLLRLNGVVSVPILNDVVDDGAALVTPRLSFALALLLSYESHGQLADVNRMVWVLMILAVLVNQVEVQIVYATFVVLLDRAETATVGWAFSVAVVGVSRALARLIGRSDVVVEACIDLFVVGRSLSVDRTDGHLGLISCVVCHVSVLSVVVLVAISALKEALTSLIGFVLSCVEDGLVLVGVGRARCRGSDASYVRRVRALSLDRLCDGIVQIDDEVLVDGVLVRGLACLCSCRVGTRVHTPSLSASLVVRRHSLRVLVASIAAVLDCRVIKGVVLAACVRNRRADVVIHLAAMLDLLGVDGRCHVQVLLTGARGVRREVCCSAGIMPRLVSLILDVGPHAHLLLEVDLGLLVAFLAVFQLLVASINQVVAGGDVVVSIVLDALLGVFTVKVKLLDNFAEQLIFHGHLLFAREQSLITVPVFHLQGPSVVSDVTNAIALLRVRVKDSPDQVLALGAEEFGHRVISRHDLLVEITRFRVLKRQVATDHCIKDYTRGPNVSPQTMIALACNHFGSCVARRTTGRLERGATLVHVGETEVDDLKSQVVVEQQVLRLQITMANSRLVDILDARD